jgi:chromosomal replication initiation ATPase DnaA
MIHPYTYAGLKRESRLKYDMASFKDIVYKESESIFISTLKETSLALNIEPALIVSTKRDREFVMARQIISHILKKYYGITLCKIAKFLNKNDHSTIINNLNKHDIDYKYDDKYRTHCNVIINNVL